MSQLQPTCLHPSSIAEFPLSYVARMYQPAVLITYRLHHLQECCLGALVVRLGAATPAARAPGAC
jgi:hypothetical protein